MVVTWMLTLNSNAVFSWTGLKTCITSLHVLVRIILDFLKVRIRVTQSLNAHFWLHKESTCGKSRTILSRFILCGIIWILMSKAISLCIFTKTVFANMSSILYCGENVRCQMLLFYFLQDFTGAFCAFVRPK